MYAIVAIHILNEGHYNAAMENIGRNTDLAKSQEGFVSRRTLVSQSKPVRITNITTWDSREHLEAWQRNPNRRTSPTGTYSAAVDSEVYQIIDV